ncbi:MAG: DNA translocase FtsK 4TM domain-containing protein [Limimaricola soesokkakensis]|uniref:DNA translocase FtsK 4TM domain-containing protein n=1 Tax=Limimaricola soesokkakensis TaxID=1343159 RepID=UPI0040589875
MAYQTRGREPLFDSNTQAALEKRGKELLGLVLIAMGLMVAMMIGSYSPDDPNWMLASDAPVQNWLGRFGASVAQPIVMIVGRGAWMLPLVFLTWGARLTLHRGEDRAMSRLMFAPIVVALAAVFAATLTPPDGWSHNFGLGGLFGDTVLGLLLTVLPFGPGLGVNLLALLLGAGTLAAGAYVTGFTREETQGLWRLVLLGLVLAYALGLRLMGRGATVSMRAAEVLRARIGDEIESRREQMRRDAAIAAEEDAAARAVPEPDQTQRVAAVVRAHAAKRMASISAAARPAASAASEAEEDEALIEDSAPARRMPPAVSRVMPRQPAPVPPAPPMTEETGWAEDGWSDDEQAQGDWPEDDWSGAASAAQDAAPARRLPPAPPGTLAAPPRPARTEEPSSGLLSRMPQLLRRTEPRETSPAVPVEPPLTAQAAAERPADDDRIRSRISDAIRARTGQNSMPPFQHGRIEPSLTRGRGPKPLMINKTPRAVAGAGLAAAGAGLAAAGQALAGQALGGARADAAPAPRVEPPLARDMARPDPFGTMPEPQPVEAGDDVAYDATTGWTEQAAPQEDWTQMPEQALEAEPHQDWDVSAEPQWADEVEEAVEAEAWQEPEAPMSAPVAPQRPTEPPLTARREPAAPARTPAPAAPPLAAHRAEPVAARQSAPQGPAAEIARAAPQPAPVAPPSQPATPQVAYPEYEYPPLDLLMDPAAIERHHLPDAQLEENARQLESVLEDYGVKGEIVSVRPGPVVTMYELEPAPGLKASRVIGLADDIARSMSALSARVSTVPGRSVIGIELPNAKREMVALREILTARDYGDNQMKLPLALGKDIGGEPVIANLAKMPHLLIAGTTGSGKSVAINTMILSLLYKLTPEECRLIMIDPKMLELSVYDGIPHLLSPVVTDPKKAVVALKWVVGEMEERYRKMSKMGVRNIDGYNGRVRDALSKGEMFSRTVQTGFDEETGDPIFETDEFQPEVLPYIVVIVDEMADLMMVAGKEIEACMQRLAQMARASGIHLIMATQRPSVDVITGTIKANFPTRISFSVTSKIDSRTILGEQGAEQLLGMGDMLYMAGGSKITRVHGPFCSDEEVEEIVTYLKGFGPPDYVGGVVEGPDEDKSSDIDAVLGLAGGGSSTSGSDSEDALYDQAVQIVAKDRKCSTSYIQRKLAIGYNKAARLVEQMEDQGVVSSANHVGKREVLVPEVH